jgi:hypothetical protein
MIKEIYDLVVERLDAARAAPVSSCQACAVEELSEVLQIIREVCWYNDEPLEEEE